MDDARRALGGAPYRDFDYPRLTPGPRSGRWVPGVETFRVEEVPRYPFAGEGEHALVRVEKVGRTTREVAVGAARRMGVRPAAVGYAGMKDKAATAVQWFSVTGADEAAAAEAFQAEGCRCLEATRHRNKLRLGHLSGNRFTAFLRGVELEAVRDSLAELAERGVPNYYGPQRFGARGDNAAQGLAVLLGTLRAKRWKRDLLVSALQSFVFNEVLARRLEGGTLDRALAGDLLRREDSGGLFTCEDPESDAARVRAFEVSPTGPLPGRKMLRPARGPAEAEAAVLRDLGLADELFDAATGTRRPLRARLEEPGVEPGEGGAWVRFTCPAGAFATSVLREVAELG